MSPIRGYTDLRRLPRIGKLHLGIKQQSSKSDATYPKAVEWFEVHEDPTTSPEAVEAFREAYGDKPTELQIMFPTDDDLMFADANYKAYSMTHGLICKGDGETADARWDMDRNGIRPEGVEKGTWANRETKGWTRLKIPCLAEACPMQKQKQCRAVMNLQFLLPNVRGIGVWQVDTGSWHSIVNIRANIELIKAATGGHIRGIELTLRRVSKKVTPAGEKAKNVWVLDVYNPLNLAELMNRAARLQSGANVLLLPAAEDEPPEDTEFDADGLHATPEGVFVDRDGVVQEPPSDVTPPAENGQPKPARAPKSKKASESPDPADDALQAEYTRKPGPDDGDPGPTEPDPEAGLDRDIEAAPAEKPVSAPAAPAAAPQTYSQQIAAFQREHELSPAQVCDMLGIEYALEPSPVAALTKAIKTAMVQKDCGEEKVYEDWLNRLQAAHAQTVLPGEGFDADAGEAAKKAAHP